MHIFLKTTHQIIKQHLKSPHHMLDFTVNSLNTHFAQASVQLPACNLHTSVAFHTPRRV